MKTLEQSSKKIKKICDMLREEAIEPGKKAAEALIAQAKERAHEIIKDAERQAGQIMEEAKATIEQERNVFQSTLTQAARLSMETLKQEIELKMFSNELQSLLDKKMSEPQVIARLVEAVINAIEKEGISTDLSVIVPNTVNPKEVNQLLGERLVKSLKEGEVSIGDFAGGAKVKIHDKKITLEITGKALLELFAGYAPNFRKFFFQG